MRRVLILVLALAVLAPDVPASAGDPPDPGEIKPEIEWKKIPFGAKRKRQMAGEAETPGVWDEVSKLLDQAERDVLTPLRIAAAHKCEATQKYIQTLISLEKLRLLAGLTNDAFSSRVQQEVIRATDAAFPVCEREAIEKCRAASDPSILVKFWITFDRQRSLRGLPAVAATGDFMARARRMCVDADQFEFSGSGTAIDHGQPVPITWHYWGLRCPDDETWRIWEKFDGVQQTVNLPPGAPQGPIVVRFDTNGAITSSVWPPLGNVPGTLQGTKLTLSPGDEPTQVIATINEGEGPPIAAAAPIGPADDLLRHCGARAGE